MLKRLVVLGAIASLLGACASDPSIEAASAERGRPLSASASPSPTPSLEDPSPSPSAASDDAAVASGAIDPRTDGFEIALGEWAVTPEAPALRPGRVTFVIHNRGTMPHGFEIELEGESSGSGSGDLFKAESETLAPGESTRMTVDLTRTGIYKIECLVDGHDDMGMEGPLEVSEDAPLVEPQPAEASGGGTEVAIANFAFDPPTIEVDRGTTVTWANEDPAPHTVTALDDTFDSDTLDEGAIFSFTFERPGSYAYRCNVHPDMQGKVEVR